LTESEAVFKNFFRPYPGAVSIYIHFPFCTNLCSYCDFCKEPYTRDRAARLFKAIGYETEMALLSLGHEPIDVASIYIGGGTPSLLDPSLLEDWVRLIKTYVRFLPDCEFSIEANPESLTDEFASRIFEAGVNRIIIGAQSFAITPLMRLNRKQTTRDIYRAFYRARSAGFENIAADLIFGLPEQTMKMVKTDIERLTALDPAHISFYQLTVEESTPLAKQIESGEIELPDEDTVAAMYRFGAHMLIDRKYRRYEVSNFARDGRRSRHNYAYWSGAPYIGLGPSAHGFVNNCRYGNVADINRYLENVEAGRLPIGFVEELTDEQRLIEQVMLSLRTAEGLDKQKLVSRFGDRSADIIDSPTTRRYIKSGHLLDDSGFLRLTDAGFLVADKIIADLLG
jgi:oxygen-independent coproporphyrinogen-3 oxidase